MIRQFIGESLLTVMEVLCIILDVLLKPIKWYVGLCDQGVEICEALNRPKLAKLVTAVRTPYKWTYDMAIHFKDPVEELLDEYRYNK